MRQRQYILPCGRVHFVNTLRSDDFVNSVVSRSISRHRKRIFKFVEKSSDRPRQATKTFNKQFYQKFLTYFAHETVNQLLESNKVFLNNEVYLAVGPKVLDNHLNWNTNGKAYSTRVYGMKSNHIIQLSGKRAKELHERIVKGQKFHP